MCLQEHRPRITFSVPEILLEIKLTQILFLLNFLRLNRTIHGVSRYALRCEIETAHIGDVSTFIHFTHQLRIRRLKFTLAIDLSFEKGLSFMALDKSFPESRLFWL